MAKVMILASYAPSLLNFRGPLMKALTLKGHKVVACAPDISIDIEKKLSQINVTGHSLSMQRTGVNPLKDWKTLAALKKIIVKEKPDVLLGYTIKPVIYGSLVSRYARVPETYAMITGLGYTFFGDTIYRKLLSRFVQLLYRAALKGCRFVFFQNPDDINLFLKLRLVKKAQAILINGSGVDLDHFQVTPLPSVPSFLLIARLIKEKGIYEYAEAARIIRKQYPEIKFALVGWIDSSPAAIHISDLQKWQQDGLIQYSGRVSDVRMSISCLVCIRSALLQGGYSEDSS